MVTSTTTSKVFYKNNYYIAILKNAIQSTFILPASSTTTGTGTTSKTTSSKAASVASKVATTGRGIPISWIGPHKAIVSCQGAIVGRLGPSSNHIRSNITWITSPHAGQTKIPFSIILCQCTIFLKGIVHTARWACGCIVAIPSHILLTNGTTPDVSLTRRDPFIPTCFTKYMTTAKQFQWLSITPLALHIVIVVTRLKIFQTNGTRCTLISSL
mmetsp:Transcript_19329/g.45007  ORF Transcript_19329/g.45007 Transcript_19329/m.45007 type:complete len:214 (-) Transcript_19329:620-1261(-)